MFTPSTATLPGRGGVRAVRVALVGLVLACADTASAAGRLENTPRGLNSLWLPPDPPYAEPTPEPSPQAPGPNAPSYAAAPSAAPAPNDAAAPREAAAPSYAAAPPAEEPPAPVGASRRLQFPDWSLRIDPANWLLYGRLGVHLEFALLDWLTLQTSPIFSLTEQPPLMFEGVRQGSNGIGPLAGSTLEAGFWLSGRAFQGPVLHLGISNYGYRFSGVATRDLPPNHVSGETIDETNYTERRLSLFFGTVHRFGPLSLSASFGLGYELNQKSRCLDERGEEATGRCDGFLLRRATGLTHDAADLHALAGPFYPISLLGRLAVGVVFD